MDWALLDRARELGAREQGLAVVVTTRADGSAQASVVNAGVLPHPVTSDLVVGFVVRGAAAKLANLRHRPRATVVFRSGWDWVTVEGDASLAGPNDAGHLPAQDIAGLVSTVYAAAVGGTLQDWSALEDTFAAEEHTAVLVRPVRIYSNTGS